MLVLLARGDQWNRTEKNPKAPPTASTSRSTTGKGFSTRPQGMYHWHMPAVVSSRSTFSSTHTSVPPGAELTAAYGRTFYFKEGEFERGDRQGMEGTTGKVCVCARAQCEGLGASTGVCARE